jgi:molybdopterin-guanine dinucleotide biosynthesis protein A
MGTALPADVVRGVDAPRGAPPWTGLVLAGGRSSRMGRDKALLPWRGQTMLQHMQALLRAAGAARVLVSGGQAGPGAIADAVAHAGPLGGIASVAGQLADGPLLVVPVDMPRLTPVLLRAIADDGSPCACYRGHALPLWLRLDARSRQAIDALMRQAPALRSPRALHAALQGHILAVPSGADAALANCNTPQEWEAVRS